MEGEREKDLRRQKAETEGERKDDLKRQKAERERERERVGEEYLERWSCAVRGLGDEKTLRESKSRVRGCGV